MRVCMLDRETEKQRDRQTERQKNRETCRQRDRQMQLFIERLREREVVS